MLIFRSILSIILLLNLCYSVNAGIGFSPVNFNLDRNFNITTLEINNTFDKSESEGITKYFQVNIFKWQRVNNKDVLSKTDDLITTPAIFEIEPNNKQIVRIAREKASLSKDESAYRIQIQEIPNNLNNRAKFQVSIAYNILLPMFIEPETKKDLSTDNVIISAKSGKINIKNKLNYHLKVIGIINNKNSTSKKANVLQYIFPNESIDLNYTNADDRPISILFDDYGKERKIDIN